MNDDIELIGTSTNNEFDNLFRGVNQNLAYAIKDIIVSLKKYWPLTVRQVYYQCVSHGYLLNKQNNYRKVSRTLSKLRINDLVSWQAIEDRSRRTTDKRGVENMETFIYNQTESFLDWRYYHRCRVQTQDIYLEVTTEKDALAGIMEEIVWPYCVRLNVGKGQISTSMTEKIASRYDKAIMQGKRPVMLYFGDLDPSGVAIPKSLQRKLYENHSVDVELIRCGLNPEQLAEYELPQSYEAAKPKDPNYISWMKDPAYRDTSPTELDAMHPSQLQHLLRESIESVLNMDNFAKQMAQETYEREKLKLMRINMLEYLIEEYPEYEKIIKSKTA